LDYFDVDPYWRNASARGVFRGRRVVWVNHASDWGLVSGHACQRKQLRIFADIGEAEVHQVDAPTGQVLDLLAAAWGLPPIPEPPAWATTRFFATAGLRGAVRERLAGRGLDPDEHLWAADAAWAAGRYREAARHWTLAYPGIDPATVAARRERQAACLWLRGRLRAARQLLRQTLTDAGADVDPDQRLVIAETLGRVLVHMRGLPDTRLLVTRAWVDTALTALDDLENALRENTPGRSLPIHLRARVESIRADLTGTPRPSRTADDGGPVRDFDESEALLPMLTMSMRSYALAPRPPGAATASRRLDGSTSGFGTASEPSATPRTRLECRSCRAPGGHSGSVRSSEASPPATSPPTTSLDSASCTSSSGCVGAEAEDSSRGSRTLKRTSSGEHRAACPTYHLPAEACSSPARPGDC
jgi:hypothetical protein